MKTILAKNLKVKAEADSRQVRRQNIVNLTLV